MKNQNPKFYIYTEYKLILIRLSVIHSLKFAADNLM